MGDASARPTILIFDLQPRTSSSHESRMGISDADARLTIDPLVNQLSSPEYKVEVLCFVMVPSGSLISRELVASCGILSIEMRVQ